MNKAAFSLESYSFDKVELDFTLNNSEDISINFSPSGVFTRSDNGSIYKLTFIFTVSDKEDSEPFFKIECNSTFKFAGDISFDQIPSFFYVNSIAIIFPYIRAFISTVTLQSNHSPLVLPTMNLSSLEKDLRENTTEAGDQ